jgi:SnoaL-like domain
MTEQQLRAVLAEYLDLLQRHPTAEEMMRAILTDDFETGFEDGYMWRGLDGLRDFLADRERFFDERHVVTDVLALEQPSDGDVRARTRLDFFLRQWIDGGFKADEISGACVHHWRLRHARGRWRVAAQIVDGFENLNPAAERLFATPAQGLND